MPRLAASSFVVAAFVTALLVPGAVAHAQTMTVAPSVQEGAALYAEADFEGAIDRLERALANETLSREDVELALDRIAAAQLAIGSRTLDTTLARLALVARDHRFGADVPEALAQRFARILPTVATVELRFEAEPLPSGAERVSVSVLDDPLEVVRAVELRCGELTDLGVSPRLDVPAGRGCDATARGPGGISLARARREATHEERTPPAGGGSAPAGGAANLDALWIGLGIGGGVLVLGGVIAGIAVATSQGSSNVTVVGPMITF